MPDPEKLIATVRRATELTRTTPGRSGNLIVLDAEDVLVAGDLHGNLRGFRAMLERADLPNHPRRHLILQELIHDTKADPDEGLPDLSHRLVDLFSALKCQYPDRVHLILGNHELSELTKRPIAKKGIPLNRPFRQGLEQSYGAFVDAVYDAYLDLFRALPLAARTSNRVFIVHTLPEASHLDQFDLGVFQRWGWTDNEARRGGSVYAVTWGRDNSQETADRFAALVDADLFVCGHQHCDEGFQKANDRLLIIDGTDPYPTSCLFPTREPITLEGLLAGVQLVPS
jgi:hypothetical protein